MWILGGEFFFWSKAVDPRRKPRVYCLAPEKNPPLISTTITPLSQLPVQATAGAAGWHCRANQSLTIGPRQAKKVDLGLHMALPPGFSALLLSRARLASEGVTVEGGLIDSGCRGPITCVLHNNTNVSRQNRRERRSASWSSCPHRQ